MCLVPRRKGCSDPRQARYSLLRTLHQVNFAVDVHRVTKYWTTILMGGPGWFLLEKKVMDLESRSCDGNIRESGRNWRTVCCFFDVRIHASSIPKILRLEHELCSSSQMIWRYSSPWSVTGISFCWLTSDVKNTGSNVPCNSQDTDSWERPSLYRNSSITRKLFFWLLDFKVIPPSSILGLRIWLLGFKRRKQRDLCNHVHCALAIALSRVCISHRCTAWQSPAVGSLERHVHLDGILGRKKW